jgi:hypothetical protein
LFGISIKELDKMYALKKPKDEHETRSRFLDICKAEAESGCISRMIENMPGRLQAIIDAKGGPTRY